jgi:type VI protein secretion system component Hcp
MMAITLSLAFVPSGSTTVTTIEVTAFNFDAVQTLNIGSQSSGAGAGKVVFNPFSFTRRPDGHSADFWSRLCSGTPFQKVTATVTKTGSDNVPVFTFTMGLVAVKTVTLAASEGDNNFVETITMEYGQAAYSAATMNADGTVGTAVGAGWNRVKNMQIDATKIGTTT